jgi:putative ABC transport system substrate-binding protein
MNNRRKLVIALGASALTTPFASFSQQQGKVWRVGFLAQRHVDFADSDFLYGPFRQGMLKLGYAEGKNLIIEWRSAEGQAERLPGLAAELVRLPVDVIVAFQTPAVQAAKQATSRIPIVMASAGDPVATGLIASLARPGGNITGMSGATTELAAKTLSLIREIRPATNRVAVLANADDTFTKPFLEQIQGAARSIRVGVRPIMVRGPAQYDAAFEKWVKERVDAVIVQPSLPGKPAIELALKHRLIVVSPSRAFAEAGGLISYSASPREQFQRSATFVDKILKGAKPADLPVEQPTTFELVVNKKTAKALGVTIPNSLLVQATQVIE